jgi:ferredoxin-NADP reductase
MWQLATLVDRVVETPRTTSLVFDLPEWTGHLAGQHVDVRLTAEDGYQAERSYSIASAPGEKHVTLTVDRIPDGEVSPFLTQELMVGESIEFRGPIGGFFVWEHAFGGPILLLAGGSGVVPLRSMLRHWANDNQQPTCARLLYSVRTLDDVIYQREIDELGGLENVDVQIALTQEWPDDWQGLRGRLDKTVLESAAWDSGDPGTTYICGPTPFVEALSSALVELGQDAARIKTERFGPTGK